jgi:hypothetical protein
MLLASFKLAPPLILTDLNINVIFDHQLCTSTVPYWRGAEHQLTSDPPKCSADRSAARPKAIEREVVTGVTGARVLRVLKDHAMALKGQAAPTEQNCGREPSLLIRVSLLRAPCVASVLLSLFLSREPRQAQNINFPAVSFSGCGSGALARGNGRAYSRELAQLASR